MGRASAPRKVLVVGGGPAGLEAARVAAGRGHNVVLLERSSRLGGAVVDMARKPGREELGGIADWLGSQVTRLGVDVQLNTEAAVGLVEDEKPDVLILAAGASDVAPEIDAAGVGVRVYRVGCCPDPSSLGERVLVVDEIGKDWGCAVAELVLGQVASG